MYMFINKMEERTALPAPLIFSLTFLPPMFNCFDRDWAIVCWHYTHVLYKYVIVFFLSEEYWKSTYS